MSNEIQSIIFGVLLGTLVGIGLHLLVGNSKGNSEQGEK